MFPVINGQVVFLQSVAISQKNLQDLPKSPAIEGLKMATWLTWLISTRIFQKHTVKIYPQISLYLSGLPAVAYDYISKTRAKWTSSGQNFLNSLYFQTHWVLSISSNMGPKMCPNGSPKPSISVFGGMLFSHKLLTRTFSLIDRHI